MVETITKDVQAYLDAVRKRLEDLPEQEREDLLADVEASLLESASEAGESPIAARLGPPESFAEELRAAAGLAAESTSAATPQDSVFDRLADAYRRLDADPRFARLRDVARELAPIWWLTRAYVVVAAFALLTDARWSMEHAAIPTWNIGRYALLVLVAAAILSCWLGLRSRRAHVHARGTLVVVNLALLAAAIPVIDHARQPSPLTRELHQLNYQLAYANSAASPGLAVDGRPIANIYPYSRDGRLLLDVLLYDENGNPIRLRANSVDPNRRLLVTTDGTTVFNSFPVRYYEPGTRVVADPTAGPKPTRRTFVTPAIQPEGPTPPVTTTRR